MGNPEDGFRSRSQLSEAAFEALPIPAVVVGQDFRVVFANPAGRKLLDAGGRSDTGASCHELLYGRPTACSFCPFRVGRHALEEHVVGAPGQEARAFRTSFGRIPGSPELLLETIEDVTGRRREEDRRIRTERLAAMGTMVSGVAHELNNPLTGMELNLQTIAANLDTLDREHMSKRLGMVRRDLGRASRIVTDILGFARTGPLRLHRADLRQIVERARANVVRLYAALSREVRWDIQSAGDTVFQVNPEKIERVFINLFRNSLQALDYRSGTIQVYISRTETGCRIVVEDDAGGIPPRILERIFEPFAPGSGQSRGSGLGLAICHNIVAEHRGRIQVHSAAGKTRFVITLPAVLSDNV